MKRWIAGVAVGLFVLTGCAVTGTPQGTAPSKQTGVMPDGYADWYRQCDGSNGVYTTDNGGGVFVLAHDVQCGG